MTNIDDDRDPHSQCLERMRNEFLAGQQRRRDRVQKAALRRDTTDNEPRPAGSAAEAMPGIPVLRP